MPKYEYFCEANGETVTVKHGMDFVIRHWGELCFASQRPLAETDFDAPVRKLMSAVAISFPTGNSTYKNTGFTKLVKRDEGVYENVTATGDEHRYMIAGRPETLPHLHKKIGD